MKKKHWVLVSWRDSNIYNNQGTSKDTKVAMIKSCGFLVGEEKDCIKIARDKIGDEHDEWRGLIVIPIENVMAKTYL